MKAFGATPSKRNVTEERAEMVQRLIEVCHSLTTHISQTYIFLFLSLSLHVLYSTVIIEITSDLCLSLSLSLSPLSPLSPSLAYRDASGAAPAS
jgi:hypothetical protein